MKLRQLPVFFLDLQTTGNNAERSSVLEIAFGTEADGVQSYLIAQPEGIPRPIQLLTGITDDEMKNAVDIAIVEEKLRHFLWTQERTAVIHFAQFEKPFLKKLFKAEIPFPILCTHQIATRLFPGLPTKGIRGIAGYFGHRLESVKRSREHIEATEFIWKNLLPELEKQEIEELEALAKWLGVKAKKRTKYEYALKKEVRLELPDKPGIYRMKNALGEILYVGKATSLHSRVNSYFRGQKNRHPRTMELLTQVKDIEVTACGSPLEAAILETDEIKKWNPPYNVALKTGHRALIFFARDMTTYGFEQSDEYPIGPFSSAMVLDSVLKLSHALLENEDDVILPEDLFFEEIDTALLKHGYLLFCENNKVPPHRFSDMRAILAQGLRWCREGRLDEKPEESEEEKQIVTPEKLAARFERHFIRSGKAYRRVRKLSRYLNCEVSFDLEAQARREFSVRAGKILSRLEEKAKYSKYPWRGLGIDTYDRISILLSELQKCENVKVQL